MICIRSQIDFRPVNRLNASTAFSVIKNNSLWLSQKNDKEYYLNIDTYKKEQGVIRKTVSQDEAVSKLKQPMNVQPSEMDKDKFYNNPDKAKGERYKQWLKNVQGDIYINETVNIVKDIMDDKAANTVKQ